MRHPNRQNNEALSMMGEKWRTIRLYNMDILEDISLTQNGMPVIAPEWVIPSKLIGANYAATSKDKKAGIHFYLEDYQIERMWRNPDVYVDMLIKYECILTPDYSLYTDMPMPMKIWNVYRSRLLGAYYQAQGIPVIPTVSWAEPETYDFCFDDLPKGCVVSVSNVGVKRDRRALEVWYNGMAEMVRRLKPSTILLYGTKTDFEAPGTEIRLYQNEVTKAWKQRAENGGKR